MDAVTKRELAQLMVREDLDNNSCADCGERLPQWVSLSHAIWICLSCAGIHRGFGVHISFVRSVQMDTFSADQLRRMKLGGNAPFKQFLEAYAPQDKGGYSPDMNVHEKYHCWAAQQYREKLSAELEDQPWAPSLPSPKAAGSDSAQGLRKTRGRSGAPLKDEASSGWIPSEGIRGSPSAPLGEKGTNEAFFESLGAANAARSADLPPSQGGRYTGFGSTPDTSSTSHPSFGLSSAAAPSLGDVQADPLAALGMGWSLFSSAVVGASRVVNESVIQPSVEKLTDPNFRGGVVRSMSTSAKNANEWGRAQLGVDVGGFVAGVANKSKGTYTAINPHGDHFEDEHTTSTLYGDAGDEDFSKQFDDDHAPNNVGTTSSAPSSSKTIKPMAAKQTERQSDEWGDDEW